MVSRDGMTVELGRMKKMKCNENDWGERGWNERTFRDGMWWNDIEDWSEIMRKVMEWGVMKWN